MRILYIVFTYTIRKGDGLINIKPELPDSINEAVKPLAKSVGETLASIWDIVFGDINTYAMKKNLLRNADLESFKESLCQKIEDIPQENLQEPSLAVVGPTLEKSKYYYEEKDLRELFANLLTSSMDKSKSQFIHPSFPDIIQNLSSDDARFLKEISSLRSIPYCELRFQNRNRENFTSFFTYITEGVTLSNFILDLSYPEEDMYDFNPIIDNLSRLRLISIPGTCFADIKMYEKFINNPFLVYYQNELMNNADILNKEVTMITGCIEITSFGEKFIRACVI